MHLSRLILPFVSLLSITATASPSPSLLTITVPPSRLLPNPHLLSAGTHATLTTLPSSSDPSSQSPRKSHILTAPINHASTFVFAFHDLPSLQPQQQPHQTEPESYLLDIRSTEFVFAPLRVDVSRDGVILGVWEMFRGNPWDNRGVEKFGAASAAAAVPAGAPAAGVRRQRLGRDVVVEGRVIGRRSLFEERPKFSPLTLFQNPMILLGVVAMGVMFGMPKIMENMDPETRAEFEKQSRNSPLSGASRNSAGGAGGPANFDLAGWMAGTSPGPMAAAESDAARISTGRENVNSARRRG